MAKTKKGRTTKKATGREGMRQRLEDQRNDILSLYQHDLKVGQAASDEGTEDIVDRANNSYNREFMLALSDTERQILLEIDRALERLDEGSYGHCLHCHGEIPDPRLQAVPWARYCIDCQEKVEQGLILEA